MSSETALKEAGLSAPANGSTHASANNLANDTGDEKGHPLTPVASRVMVRPVSGWRWFLAMVALYSCGLLYGLDTTVAADVQPAIVKTFPGSIDKLAWIGVGFPLGSVGVILPLGYAYGKFNIKYLFIGSLTLFEIGSAICGASNNMDALIVGRVIAGAGGAGGYLGVLNFINVFTTESERTMYVAMTGLVWGTGTILGPVVGGGFAGSGATWRWAFYINLFIFAATLPAMVFYLPNFQPMADVRFRTKLASMDWLGILLNATVYTSWVLAVTFGSGQWGWTAGGTIAMWVIFGVALIAFIITQRYSILTTPSDRLFPVQFLGSRSMIALFIGTSCSATCLFVSAYYIPLFFQFTRSDTAIMAATHLLPFITIAVFFIMVNGALMPVVGYYMPWYAAGGAFIIIGSSLLFTINAGTSSSKIYGYSVLTAVGTGITCQLAYAVVSVINKPVDVPAAVGWINTAQIGGIVVALGIAGSVFQSVSFNNLEHALAGQGFSQGEIRGAIAGTQSAVFQQGSAAVKTLAINAIVKAIDQMFILEITAGALMLVTSLVMKRERLFLRPVAGG